MAQEPNDADKKEAMIQRITAELTGAGLNVVRTGDGIGVYEKKLDDEGKRVEGGGSAGRNLGMVLAAAVLVPIAILLVAAIYFVLTLGLIDQLLGSVVDGEDVGGRAAAIAMLLATAIGGGGAIVTGLSVRTLNGQRDIAALILGLALGIPLVIVALGLLAPGLTALTRNHNPAGLIAGGVFIFVATMIGNRFFTRR